MKGMVYEPKVDTRDELLQQIFYALRHINNAAVLHTFTYFVVEWIKLHIQADGGHFEQLL
jgi:hypothetical protein